MNDNQIYSHTDTCTIYKQCKHRTYRYVPYMCLVMHKQKLILVLSNMI